MTFQPATTSPDARPLGRIEGFGEVEILVPQPPREGDPLYCEGVAVGTYGGDHLRVNPPHALPPALAAWLAARQRFAEILPIQPAAD